ncbi:tyrosine-type recombinase/integrase [Anaerostipes sp.]|uniref:tyrosine-type recombinase/integrase n=1 Tax=Anaerostipes sp. TaxID=1872530 RepID=UPI0025C55581|nr:tyrosine-type recombinase/integrase [Anaerostipes sp.]MBS7008298.1 tyrosine-type recombinase/integrase [Anaerostipes sp.]
MGKIRLQQNSSAITLKEMFQQFIDFKVINNLSSRTIGYYEKCFQYFSEYFSEENTCDMVTSDTFYGYITYLRTEHPNANDISINSYLRGIRAILYYGMDRGYIKTFSVKLIKATKKIKETYTDEELRILLKKPDIKKCSFAEYRDWALINYLLGTGNRISTALNVHNCDIHYDSNEIFLSKTKNRRQQIIPLSQSLTKILQEYLIYRKGNPEDYLFCTENGNQLSVHGIQSSIQKYNRKRGVQKTSLHLFRHAFAKNWILNGGDIFRLQKILGHSSMDIVKEYVQIYGNELHMQFNEFNPLENILRETEGERIKMR